jgi:Abi-like protein
MNPDFFDKIQPALAAERLDAYRQDQAEPQVALARYLWNMALCESLYSPLQMVEIALRNALQRSLENHFHSPHWYDVPACWHLLTTAQQSQIDEAKQTLARQNKPLAPGRIVAELTFGFWTAFFNKRSAQNRDIIQMTAQVFHSAPKSQRDFRSLNRRLTLLRELRNRVFHHERLIHWADLDSRHLAMLETIGWISVELQELAIVLDRFPSMRKAGIQPWLEKLRRHWPAASTVPAKPGTIEILPAPLSATNGIETPFGHRWGGDVFRLTLEHLSAMQTGQTLALDVMNEYITFLQLTPETTTNLSTSSQA